MRPYGCRSTKLVSRKTREDGREGSALFAAFDTLSSSPAPSFVALNIWSRFRLSCILCSSSCLCAKTSSRSISGIDNNLSIHELHAIKRDRRLDVLFPIILVYELALERVRVHLNIFLLAFGTISFGCAFCGRSIPEDKGVKMKVKDRKGLLRTLLCAAWNRSRRSDVSCVSCPSHRRVPGVHQRMPRQSQT